MRFKKTPPLTASKALTSLIASTNFNLKGHRSTLAEALAQRDVPYLYVGKYFDDMYRIVLCADGLRASDPEPPATKKRTVVLDIQILGVNANIQSGYRHAKPLSTVVQEMDQIEGESEDSEIEGFVFHQLGRLQVWHGDPKKLRELQKNEETVPWVNSDYCAVVRIGANGRADGIYAISDYHIGYFAVEARHEGIEKRLMRELATQVYNHDDDDTYFPDLSHALKTGEFAIGRISGRITDLKMDRTFSLSEINLRPIELVRAV